MNGTLDLVNFVKTEKGNEKSKISNVSGKHFAERNQTPNSL